MIADMEAASSCPTTSGQPGLRIPHGRFRTDLYSVGWDQSTDSPWSLLLPPALQTDVNRRFFFRADLYNGGVAFVTCSIDINTVFADAQLKV